MTQATHLPYQGRMAGFRRFSVAEYHRLIELGMLTEGVGILWIST
jgi:hypothetical protein